MKLRSAENPIAPALINVMGCTTYFELLDNVVKISNYFDDRRLPRLGKAYLNFANPDLRLIVTIAALDYGLIPLLGNPETLKGNFDFDFAIGGSEPFRTDIPADLVIDQSVLTGRLADNRMREFPERSDDDLSFVAETTGTTGRPKLVAITYSSHKLSFSRPTRRRYTPTDRVMYTIGGATRFGLSTSEMALADGAAVVGAPVEPIDCLKMINLFNVTELLTTPKFLERALDQMDAHNLQCQSVRKIRLTGSTFSSDLLKRTEDRFSPETEINVAYGTSEVGRISGGIVTSKTYRRGYVGEVNPNLKFLSAGTRDNPAQIKIVNDEKYFTKYIADGKIIQYIEPFVNIPDIGYFEGKTLYLTGREDEVYNYSGNIKAYNLIQEEIEKLAPARDVAIVDGSSIGDPLDLVIALVADDRLNLDELTEKLLETIRLKSAKKYFKLFQVDEIKRNKMGKIDRQLLLNDYKEFRKQHYR